MRRERTLIGWLTCWGCCRREERGLEREIKEAELRRTRRAFRWQRAEIWHGRQRARNLVSWLTCRMLKGKERSEEWREQKQGEGEQGKGSDGIEQGYDMRRRDAEGKESGWLVDLWNVFRKIGDEKKRSGWRVARKALLWYCTEIRCEMQRERNLVGWLTCWGSLWRDREPGKDRNKRRMKESN